MNTPEAINMLYSVLNHRMHQIKREFPNHTNNINAVSRKLKFDINMMMKTMGPKHVIDYITNYYRHLAGMFRQGMAMPRGARVPISTYGVQPPAMDYRDNYWIPPHEIPVEPNYFPGYNIVAGTPRNGFYNIAGSYPAMMM